ncbi:MAG: 3-methyl-2-oxobutanoate dehydrogenase subunit VorB [Tissierellia bacterium]|nr:3-methyl-2-oxobutanoate dehydrogenase subunit VorB [Bacillota bacterium]NLL22263.1 3-methyl-2-oxobutanoate dehydrogenase subunit VorB [Tissierellia bacterium]
MAKILMKGNEAVGEAAIRAGCRFFFGYPITPQSELPEYMSLHLPKVGGVYLQAESEIAAINMVYGAAGCGARVMTGSSSPGIALKQEGISYMAGAELPCVIVNMMRGGPGLGSIQPAQSDYFQSTRGGGDGDYRLLVYAPASVQEMVDYVQIAFDKADKYRNPVLVVGDGVIGQMMEPVEFVSKPAENLPEKDWATTGTGGKREPNIINSLYLDAEKLERHNIHLSKKYSYMQENEQRWEATGLEGAELVIVAYGTTARIARSAMDNLNKKGWKIGLLRPITLWPFPEKGFQLLDETTKHLLVVEMSMGQMIDDVRIVNEGKRKIHFTGRSGGVIPSTSLIEEKILEILERSE